MVCFAQIPNLDNVLYEKFYGSKGTVLLQLLHPISSFLKKLGKTGCFFKSVKKFALKKLISFNYIFIQNLGSCPHLTILKLLKSLTQVLPHP